jgi:putative cell wall-binding protein
MWQFQWMLSLLPEWVWTTMLIASIVGLLVAWLLKRIPFVSQYQFPIQAVSVVSLLISIWFVSANNTDAVWEAKIKDLEDKVKLAEEAANTKNVEIQEKIVTKTTVIKEKGKTQIEYVDRVITQDKEVVKYIEQCPVPKAIIDAHNAAAEMNKAAEGKK